MPKSSAPTRRSAPRLVHIANRQRRLKIPAARVRELVRRALATHADPGAVSLAFVGDREMRRLNRDFHATDATTDVLSFPLGEGGAAIDGLLAEIVVCTDRAAVEARRRGRPPRQELLLYVTHGALHIAGFDDHAPDDRRAMRRAERRVMAE